MTAIERYGSTRCLSPKQHYGMAQHQTISSGERGEQAPAPELVEAILSAAVELLKEDGAAGFSSEQIAKKARISLELLRKCFPNNETILLRLQEDEWQRTSAMIRGLREDRIIEDAGAPPLERLRNLVHASIRSDCENMSVCWAVAEATSAKVPRPIHVEETAPNLIALHGLMREAMPAVSEADRLLATDLVQATLVQVGKVFAKRRHTTNEVSAYAEAMSVMFFSYITSLGTA